MLTWGGKGSPSLALTHRHELRQQKGVNWFKVNEPQPGCREAGTVAMPCVTPCTAFKMTGLEGQSVSQRALNFQDIEVVYRE